MKSFFLFLILIFCVLYAKAQNPVFPLANNVKPVSLFFEKTYLHTDRDVYAQGDTLWFKAYLVNAQDNKPINSSHTLYVELIAPDSAKILNREIIRMDNGLGNGDISLADTLAPGKYRLRAYTNWMRNFGDNFFFEKEITVLNAPVAPDVKASPVSKNTAKDNRKPLNVAANHAAAVNLLPVVRFYPEGGSLVEGISSIVGVKAEDGYGAGIPVSGSVLSSRGDTVSRFSCDSLGMGLLVLLPVAGQSYQAVVNLPGRRTDVFQLPAALSKGLTLQIRQTDSVIHAIIRRNADTTVVSCSIVVKHGGKTILNQPLQLSSAQASANIAAMLLPEGISAVTLYNHQGKPECERLVYVQHHSKHTIHMAANKEIYRPKEQVSLSIQAQPNTSLSLAAVDAGIIPVQTTHIVAYLQLQSEVKGPIENASRYFDTTNINRFKQMDLLLLTQGWRDFVWRRLADTAIRISYAAESGISVPGRIWDEVRNKMLPGINVSLHADGAKGIKQFSTITDSAGRFHFDGLMLFGKQNVLLAAIDNKGNKQGSFMIDTLLPLAAKARVDGFKAMTSPADSTAKSAIIKRAESIKKAQIAGITKLKEVTIKSKQSILLNNASLLTSWGPDQIFNITPDDYQYKTLEWFLMQNTKGAVKPLYDPNRLITPIPPPTRPVNIDEYNREMREFMRPLTGVAYMGQDTFLFKTPGISDGIYNWRAKTKPIAPNIIVNGRELNMDNYEQAEAYRIMYFNMPMNKFKKVVLRHMIGTLHSSQRPILPQGMNISGAQSETIPVDRYLLYLTLADNALTDNPGSMDTDVEGYYQARTFYSPAPNTKPSLDDYRTTIHWEPNIKTDAEGKANISFYNALPQTKVRVVVQGITPDGTPLVATASYEVK